MFLNPRKKKNFKSARGKQFWFFYFLFPSSFGKQMNLFFLAALFVIFTFLFIFSSLSSTFPREMHFEKEENACESEFLAKDSCAFLFGESFWNELHGRCEKVLLKFPISNSTRPELPPSACRHRRHLVEAARKKSPKPLKSANFLTNFLFTNTKLLQLLLDAFSSQLFLSKFFLFYFRWRMGGEC